MRVLYVTLCLVAVTASPPRHYKRLTEKKPELTTEAKIEEPAKEEPVDKTKDEIFDKKEIPDELASSRAYYGNHSVNVVSSTSGTFVEEQEKQYLPQVHLGLPEMNVIRPQISISSMQPQLQPQHQPQVQQQAQAPMPYGSMSDDKKYVYSVNVYVNFPNEKESDGEIDDDCYKGKCWGKAKCKEGQISVKGVCSDRH